MELVENGERASVKLDQEGLMTHQLWTEKVKIAQM